MKNWIKEHFDTLAVVGTIIGATWTVKSDIHQLDCRLTAQIHDVDKRLTAVETIMIMQGAPIKSFTAKEEPKDKNNS